MPHQCPTNDERRRAAGFSLRHWWGIRHSFSGVAAVKHMWAVLILIALSAQGAAQTSFPMVTHVTPAAVQRGTTSEVTVDCRTSTLYGAYKVLGGGSGVTAEVAPAKDAKPAEVKNPPPVVQALKLKVAVAADAACGVREFRIASTVGISSLGQLVIVDAPVVIEAPGINLPEKAQPIPIPSVVC